MSPRGHRGLEADEGVFERVAEGEAVGVEAHRGGGWGEGLARAEAGIFQINGVADDGVAEVPEVRADLVGAAGERAGFDQGGAVGVAA